MKNILFYFFAVAGNLIGQNGNKADVKVSGTGNIITVIQGTAVVKYDASKEADLQKLIKNLKTVPVISTNSKEILSNSKATYEMLKTINEKIQREGVFDIEKLAEKIVAYSTNPFLERLIAVETQLRLSNSDSLNDIKSMRYLPDEEEFSKRLQEADQLIAKGRKIEGVNAYRDLADIQTDKRVASIILSELADLYIEGKGTAINIDGGGRGELDIGKSNAKAELTAEEALRLWPDNISAIQVIAELEIDKIDNQWDGDGSLTIVDYTEALTIVRKGINVCTKLKLEPDNFYDQLFSIYKSVDMYSMIVADATIAYNNSPTYFMYKNDIGQAYLFLGKYKDAISHLADAYYYAKADVKLKEENRIYGGDLTYMVASNLIASHVLTLNLGAAKTLLVERIKYSKIDNSHWNTMYTRAYDKLNDPNFSLKNLLTGIDFDNKPSLARSIELRLFYWE